jgi:hypothetical protein
MKFQYKIEAEDFLEFQLYTASKDPIVQGRKRKSWIILPILFSFMAAFSFMSETFYLAVYFVVLAIVIALFYPKYFSWRYKKHYASFIGRNYAKRFGQPAELEITKDFILSKDKVAEGKVKISEIEYVSETQNHFFIKISSGMSFIIPKKEVDASIDLKAEFTRIGLVMKDELNWKW